MIPATEPLPSTLNHSPRRRWSAVSVVGLLLAACCFWQGLPALSSLWREDVQAEVAAPVPQRQLVRTKIKDLRPGRRVIAGNPELGEALADSDIDPATWRLITLMMSKPDGGRLDIELLRPVEWIADFEAQVGRTVDLDLEELGAAGPAEVLSIAPCPEIEPDDGRGRRVITGTFRHSSGNIYDVQIAGEPAPIGTTGNHPFWSEDRHAFVPAETLQPGEHLRQANGSTTTVVSLTRRETTEPVYNLEVDVDHVYHVGIGGVLVHNAYLRGFDFPDNIQRGGGAWHDLSRKGYRARVDTNRVTAAEGGFHIHLYQNDVEIAKITGRGGYVNHGGRNLLSPSQIPKDVRKELRALVDYVTRNLVE